MNEEEKRSIKFTKEYLEEEKNLRDDYKWKSGFYANGDIERLLNLIEKQEKEIKARLEEIDSLYKMMSAKDDKIDELKKDYQILKDDIEGHNVVYVDTPEFEEKYISKDKIKELIKEKAKTDTYNFRTIAVKDIEELLGETND